MKLPMASPHAVPAAAAAHPDDRFADLRGGLRLCYRAYGPPTGRPLLLVAGLGLQLTSWPAAFIDAFVQAGHHVIAPDNRDVGLSSRLPGPPPGKLQMLLGRAPAGAYGLEDMADDLAQLLDQLGAGPVHLVGMSMGGMISQAFSVRHPQRVASLTSIFSTTGARRVGQPARSTMLRMAASAPRTLDEAVARYEAMMRHVGDPAAPGIAAEWAAYARSAWTRSGNRANAGGIGRQIGAIFKSGDRTAQLRGIRARTLVIHGDVDKLVHPSGGRATADAIPGARLVTVRGMRHQIDTGRSPELAALICSHLATAQDTQA